MKTYIPYILILIIGISAFYYGKSTVKPTEKIIYKVKIDTIKKEIKRIESKIEVKYKERAKLKDAEKKIVYNEEECKEIVDNLKSQLANCDTIVMMKDTIIYKERKVIEYKDVLLDIKPKPKPFGVGIQTGYNPINGRPYIGVGISYNVLRF